MDWAEFEIGEIVEDYLDFRGKTPKKLGMDWGGGDIRALSANNVENGKINFDKECYYGSEALYKKWMNKGDCQKGDIVLTMEAPLGNVAQIPDDRKYILSQRTILLKTKPDIVSNDFLLQLLLSDSFQKELIRNSTGTTVVGIQQKKLDKIKISLPPLPQQRKIAQILSTVDNVIQKTEAAITKYQAIKQGLMQDLFTRGINLQTGKLRPPYSEASHLYKETELGMVPREWEVVKLKDITEKIGDGIHATPKYTEISDYYFINGNNLRNGRIILSDNTNCVSEDEYKKHYIDISTQTILISINGTIGNIAYYKGEKVILGKSAAFINCQQKILKGYVYQSLLTHRIKKYFENELTGSTIKNLSLNSIRNTPILLPDYSEQTEISKRLNNIDSKIESEQNYLSKLNSLKQGLMQDLLTGRVRVKVSEPQAAAGQRISQAAIDVGETPEGQRSRR